jgi:uncharacterized protein (UPF0262 family)
MASAYPVKQVSVTRFIAAPPEAIFDVLADPAKHPIIDGSGSLKVSVSPEKARVVFVRTDRPGTPTESHSYELKSLQEPKKP